MLHERIPNVANFVEPDRVRREVYTDAAIFEMEMERIHERVWVYCGHETQVPKAGDYYTLQAMRKDLRGFKAGPFLYFWNAWLAK